jgi:hypothetical protein
MSISSLSSEISRLTRDIADLQKKRGDVARKRSDVMAKVDKAQRAMAGAKDLRKAADQAKALSTLQNELSRIDGSDADLLRKLADKEKALSEKRTRLAKEEADQVKKLREENRKELDRQRRAADDLQRSIASTSRSIVRVGSTSRAIEVAEEPDYDFFISHASEDKDEVARPLAEALRAVGCKVWYDELTLQVGDSLRRSIEKGIGRSRFGVVVLSETFFKKDWTQRELDGLTQQELAGESRILPLWHRVTAAEVRKFSPTLADKVALSTATKTIEEIAALLGGRIADGQSEAVSLENTTPAA